MSCGGVGGRRHRQEHRRKHSTSHGAMASAPGRTTLLASATRNERRAMGTLTWLGHAAFMLGSDRGRRIYIDPFLSGNPKTPDDEKEPDRVDVICVTHGHGDHVGDAVEFSQRFPDADVIAMVELKSWLGSKGANGGDLPGLDKGGSIELDGLTYAREHAYHSP